MNVIVKIFFLALGWYLILTLPSILVPIMYFMSLIIMLAVCWVAGLLFYFMSHIIKGLQLEYCAKVNIMYAMAALAVLAAFEAVEAFGLWDHIWQSGGFLLFPFAALVAAWIPMYMNRTALAEHFGKPNEMELAIESINTEP